MFVPETALLSCWASKSLHWSVLKTRQLISMMGPMTRWVLQLHFAVLARITQCQIRRSCCGAVHVKNCRIPIAYIEHNGWTIWSWARNPSFWIFFRLLNQSPTLCVLALPSCGILLFATFATGSVAGWLTKGGGMLVCLNGNPEVEK